MVGPSAFPARRAVSTAFEKRDGHWLRAGALLAFSVTVRHNRPRTGTSRYGEATTGGDDDDAPYHPQGCPEPDDLIVRTADTELHLESLTEEAGYGGMPDGTPTISGDELYVFVRQDGWMLFAEQRGGDPVGCGPERREPDVTDLGNGWWKVSNRSAAGTYALWLNAGSGPGLPFGGTVGASQAYVEWTTKTDVDELAASYLDITAYSDGSDGSVTLGILGV